MISKNNIDALYIAIRYNGCQPICCKEQQSMLVFTGFCHQVSIRGAGQLVLQSLIFVNSIGQPIFVAQASSLDFQPVLLISQARSLCHLGRTQYLQTRDNNQLHSGTSQSRLTGSSRNSGNSILGMFGEISEDDFEKRIVVG